MKNGGARDPTAQLRTRAINRLATNELGGDALLDRATLDHMVRCTWTIRVRSPGGTNPGKGAAVQPGITYLERLGTNAGDCWMKLAGYLLMFTATLAGAQNTPAAAPLPTVDDWRQELDQIVADIRLLHPDPFTELGRHAFFRRVDALKSAIPALTEEQRVTATMGLVAALGDGHTMLEPNNPRFALWYPIRIYNFAEGTFVTSAHQSVAELAGAQVLEIGGRPVVQALTDARGIVASENNWASSERTWAALNASLMKGLGYAGGDGSLRVKVKLTNGTIVDRVLQPHRADLPRFQGNEATFEWQFRPETFGLPFGTDDEWTTAYKGLKASAFLETDPNRPPFFADRKAYGARSIPSAKAYYVRTNYITDTDFVPFFQRVLGEVDSLKPTHFIIDWRFNFGGDGSKMQYLVREFVKRADNPPWKNLYILTGPKTFSAAIMGIDALLENVTATVVGEPSAAGLNHYGDPTYRYYQRTGLKLSVSTLRHQLGSSDDRSNFVRVDVPAPLTFADYAAGRDPAVDPILRGDDMRSVPLIALADGGLVARKAYEDRVARFRQPWATPPREYDMRQSCDLLRERGRLKEAVDTCRLTADMHPDVWNVWYNLAIAHRAAGQMAERLAAFRCVVAIAPNNWNVPAIRRLLAQPGNGGEATAPGCPVSKLVETGGNRH